jgi:DNA-binding ferritin-like protein (Dps family)
MNHNSISILYLLGEGLIMLLELKLLSIRKRQEVKLNGGNREAFNGIKEYLSNSSLVLFEREEVLQQILDIMLQAQNEDKDISLFLGRDHKKFCDSILIEYNTTKSFVMRIASFFEQLIIYIILGMLVDMIFEQAPTFSINTMKNTVYLLFVFNPMSRKSRKEKIYPTYKYAINKKVLPTGMIVVISFIPYAIITNEVLSAIGKKQGLDLVNAQVSIFSIRPLLIFGILFVIISEIYKSICNKQRVD